MIGILGEKVYVMMILEVLVPAQENPSTVAQQADVL